MTALFYYILYDGAFLIKILIWFSFAARDHDDDFFWQTSDHVNYKLSQSVFARLFSGSGLVILDGTFHLRFHRVIDMNFILFSIFCPNSAFCFFNCASKVGFFDLLTLRRRGGGHRRTQRLPSPSTLAYRLSQTCH